LIQDSVCFLFSLTPVSASVSDKSILGIFCAAKARLTEHFDFFLLSPKIALAIELDTGTEARSEKARQVILQDEKGLYFVSSVNVQLNEGQRVHRATFHAEAVGNNEHRDLDFEIPQDLFDVLVEYTKLANPDLVLLLFHQNNSFRWQLLSESQFRQCSNTAALKQYVV
jgi:hypothetical protein